MKAITILLLAALAHPAHASTAIPEPETIFYGKILNRSGPQPYLVTSGGLRWTIGKSESEALEFTANLRPVADGTYSYRLSVPHSALALDLQADPDSIPLGSTSASHHHLSILVDGHPATIAAAKAASFDAQQAARASTYRLDLEIHAPLPDSDGDGLADWWEDRYGLDKQSNDADGDPDGDGRLNLAEFLDGTDPTVDNRIPTLLTTEVFATAEGTSGVHLQAMDFDTPPSGLSYTLVSAPSAGDLTLRDVRSDPSNSDQVLAAGASFTQEAVDHGRLVYDPAPDTESSSFTVRLHDGNPEHDPSTGSITIKLYRPGAALLEEGTAVERVSLALSPTPLPGVAPGDEQRLRQFILARDGGFLQWDLANSPRAVVLSTPSAGSNPLAYLTSYGPEAPLVVTGGDAADDITGGHANDVLAGGPGNDSLTGGGGSDRFLLLGPGDGSDTITDFDLAQGDALDLSRVLEIGSSLLSDYVKVTTEGSDLVIGLDLDGDRSGFTDLTLTLTGAAGADLYSLWSGGHFVTRGVALPPRVELAASSEPASENGPTPATFTITLGSPATQPLTIGLLVTGSATNGIDYLPLPATVTIPAGTRSLEISVTPYQDAVPEPPETVHLALQSGEGYQLAANSSAQVTIADLLPEITVTALEPTAVLSSGTPGLFLIERSAIIDRSVLVRLEIGGTATIGSDFETITPFVNLAAGDTTAVIPVTPKPGASLAFDAESVRLTIASHESYRTGQRASSEVVIVNTTTSLADWRNRYFPEFDQLTLEEFANQASGKQKLTNFFRYAFALAPRNPDSTPDALHQPIVRIRDGHLSIEFTRNLAARDLRWTVESSNDLKTWNPDSSLLEDVSDSLNSGDTRRKLFRVIEPVHTSTAAYLRVRAVYHP